MNSFFMGWTTTETHQEAERLAVGSVNQKLAACAQIDGPITSIYTWKGEVEKTTEYRIILKFPEEKAEPLQTWLLQNHPYETPQWIVVAAHHVSPAYWQWAHKACPSIKFEN